MEYDDYKDYTTIDTETIEETLRQLIKTEDEPKRFTYIPSMFNIKSNGVQRYS